jgi:flavodoxin
MKTLIIYDSNFGNTQLVANAIAEVFGKTALCVSLNNFKTSDLEGIDVLIVGSPINAWAPTKKTTGFLDSLGTNKLNKIDAAAFDTRMKIFCSGNAAKKIAKKLVASGANLVLPPEGFYVTDKEGPLANGEIERAKNWAGEIKVRLKTTLRIPANA